LIEVNYQSLSKDPDKPTSFFQYPTNRKVKSLNPISVNF